MTQRKSAFDTLIEIGEKLDLAGEQIADVLWLALKRQEFEANRSSATVESVQEDAESQSRDVRLNCLPIIWLLIRDFDSMAGILFLRQSPIAPETNFPIPSLPKRNRSNRAPIYTDRASASQQALPLRVPDAPSLRDPLTVVRALHPLMRRIHAGNRTILDEAATVRRVARERICVPVLQPELEPWLDLALVIDESQSMLIWRQTLRDLERLLTNYGIFRDLRVWGMKLDETGNQFQVFARSRTHRIADPKELVDPTGRRSILIVSDCVSHLWRKGIIFPVLQDWTKYQPLAVVQLLPPWMWRRTALGLGTAVGLSSSTAGAANRELLVNKQFLSESRSKIPIFTLEPQPANQWSQMVAGKADATVSGYLLPTQLNIAAHPLLQRQQAAISSQNAQQRVERFRATTSLLGRKLAGLLAAAPVITLPVVRLIQETLLPQSRQVQVAEVFLGGLLRPITKIEPQTHPDVVEYEFIEPEIRSVFLEDAPAVDATDVLNAVSRYVAEQMGKSLDEFMGLLKNPADAEREGLKPFAEITTRILKQLGEPYARLAAEIEAEWKGEISEPAPELTEAESTEEGAKPQRDALVVGIAEYESPNLRNLSKPVKDAEAIARLLEEYGDCTVTRLQGTVTLRQFEEALNDLFAPTSANKEVILYFTGNGFRGFASPDSLEDSQGFLAASDCQLDANRDRAIVLQGAISYRRLAQLIQGSPHLKSLTIIIDTSNSGVLIEDIARESSPFPQGVKGAILTSCGADEDAWSSESDEYSIFTGVLLKALAPEKANAEGEISAARAWDDISRTFNQLNESTRRQTPLYFSSGKSPILLKYPPVAPSLDTRQLEALLQQQQWQEADRETERLIRLAAGQEKLRTTQLTGRQTTQLQSVLMSAYPTSADLEMTLDFELGESPEAFGDYADFVLYAIRWAEARGHLGELVSAVMRDQPENEQLQAFGRQLHYAKIELEALTEISCADWQEIDRAWRQYSDQCFGLGAQLSIWQRDDDGSLTYHKHFADCVGWGRLEGAAMRWRELDALDFSLTAPPGHLPRAWYKNCGGTLKDIFSFLGERWVECNIEQPQFYNRYRKAHEKLYQLWGNKENTNKEKWREIFRLLFAEKENQNRFRQGFSKMLAVQHNPTADTVFESELRKRKNELSAENFYDRLENHLSQKEWKEADEETAWLFYFVMVQQEYKNWYELCCRFPRHILNEIDWLWVNYSDKKFGFSIQSRIWLGCENKENISGFIHGDWVEFGKKVGWHNLGTWKDYNSLSFTIESKEGSLPALALSRASGMSDHFYNEPNSGFRLGLGFFGQIVTTEAGGGAGDSGCAVVLLGRGRRQFQHFSPSSE